MIHNESVIELASQFKEALKSSLNIDANFSPTTGDYGTSCYFSFERNGNYKKVRVSDHSVESIYRMFGEIHVTSPKEVSSALLEVEQFIYPERFKVVEKMREESVIVDIKKGTEKEGDVITRAYTSQKGNERLVVTRVKHVPYNTLERI